MLDSVTERVELVFQSFEKRCEVVCLYCEIAELEGSEIGERGMPHDLPRRDTVGAVMVVASPSV